MNTNVSYDDLEYTEDGLFLLNGMPFTGTAADFNGKNVKIGEVSFLDGREHGVARSWYDNGGPASETPYVHGVMHGTKREWFESGSLRKESAVEFGVLMKEKEFDHRGEATQEFERETNDPLFARVLKLRQEGGADKGAS